MLEVTLVGTGGMMPLKDRHLASMILKFKTTTILVDCGEGTQISLQKIGSGFKSIDVICLTHFHADHVAGLPGLLCAISNSGREEHLTIIGPKDVLEVCSSLLVIAKNLNFNINYVELEDGEIYIEEIKISSLKLEHRIPCVSYKFETKRSGKFNIEKALEFKIPKTLYSILQRGEDVTFEGVLYEASSVIGPIRDGFKIVYCTDTRPISEIIDFAKNSTVFVCEGIYGEDSKIEKAKEYKHMLFSEAAFLAKEANVKELWLTHYSPSMKYPEDFLEVATSIFENSYAGFDGKTKIFKYED